MASPSWWRQCRRSHLCAESAHEWGTHEWGTRWLLTSLPTEVSFPGYPDGKSIFSPRGIGALRFIERVYGTPLPEGTRNTLVLTTDYWDDYGTQSLYHASYRGSRGELTELGTVKILQRKSPALRIADVLRRTEIPAEFEELGADYIALGQSPGFYQNLHSTFNSDQVKQFLEAVGDIAWNPDIGKPFEPTSAYRNSLFRSNSAHQARRFGRALALGEEIEKDFSFTYLGEISGADAPVEMTVPFDADDSLPGRVVCIIGRNAVGKTQFLTNLAKDLVQINRSSSEKEKKREDRFRGHRPLFTRVLTVSYSAFDKFARPKSQVTSYVYCGIRGEKGQLSRNDLIERYRENLSRIRAGERQHEWRRYMKEILGTVDRELLDKLQAEIGEDTIADSGLSLLSSGQAILAHFVTALLAWLEPNSLVLFDEPETHLHPNAVASLFNVLTSVLEAHDSFAVIATHSPIVLQEVPAKRVVVFQREGNLTEAEPLSLESFGESISELTRHVFETIEIPTLYRRTFRRLSTEESFEDTVARFDRELSLSAQAYLIAQHERPESEDDEESL